MKCFDCAHNHKGSNMSHTSNTNTSLLTFSKLWLSSHLETDYFWIDPTFAKELYLEP